MVVPVIELGLYIYIALYSAVNGPERSSRFYVFYNTFTYIMATVGYS